ncbi:cystatin family protein [Nocardia brasiliensis]|nr:cystatin family protein [Nocardia brasiliensis]
MTAHRLRLGWICLIVAGVAIAVCAGNAHAEPSSEGKWSAADPNSDGVASATAFAVSKFNDQSNTLHYRKLIRIVDAKQRVQAGILYRVAFEMADTVCRKSQAADANCAVDPHGHRHRCTAEVWVKPWEDFAQLRELECEAMP